MTLSLLFAFMIVAVEPSHLISKDRTPAESFAPEQDCNPVAHLVGTDTAQGDGFSDYIALDERFLVVGAHAYDEARGAAYVFRRTRSGWTEDVRLMAGDAEPGDHLSEVSIHNNRIIAGANQSGVPPYVGKAYIFRLARSGWVEEARLTADDASPYDYFGTKVAIHGRRAAVGAFYADGLTAPAAGAVYTFHLTNGEWVQDAKIMAGDGQYTDAFCTVSIENDVLLVGAFADDDAGNDAGSAYIFRRQINGWVEEAKLIGQEVGAGDQFGTEVALSGNWAAIAAPTLQYDDNPAYVYMYRKNVQGWEETDTLGLDQIWDVVVDVSIAGERALVTAITPNGSSLGYLYQNVGRRWILTMVCPDLFGHTDLAGDFAAVGSLNRPARIFDFSTPRRPFSNP